MTENDGRVPRRCQGLTRKGQPCRRRAGAAQFCRVHATTHATAQAAPAFYARALDRAEQEHYAEALTQEGLAGEIAVLRLHLLRLVERNDEGKPGEVPRVVHALIRALRGHEGGGSDAVAALDAAVRAEGLRPAWRRRRRRCSGRPRRTGVTNWRASSNRKEDAAQHVTKLCW